MELLHKLVNVIIISLMVASPIIVVILLLYIYRRYKKWAGTDKKQAERIIVKMNDDEASDKVEEPRTIEQQFMVFAKKLLEKEKQAVTEAEETNEASDEVEEDPRAEYESMNIRELHKIAKERGMTHYSRLPKEKLIDRLI